MKTPEEIRTKASEARDNCECNYISDYADGYNNGYIAGCHWMQEYWKELNTQTKQQAVDDMVNRLAILYKTNPLAVAIVCDEALDRSGRLLGTVRDIVRKTEDINKPNKIK